MTIDLYYLPLSPPCRSIIMLAKTLNIELNLKKLDLFAGEHLKPDFLKVSRLAAPPSAPHNPCWVISDASDNEAVKSCRSAHNKSV